MIEVSPHIIREEFEWLLGAFRGAPVEDKPRNPYQPAHVLGRWRALSNVAPEMARALVPHMRAPGWSGALAGAAAPVAWGVDNRYNAETARAALLGSPRGCAHTRAQAPGYLAKCQLTAGHYVIDLSVTLLGLSAHPGAGVSWFDEAVEDACADAASIWRNASPKTAKERACAFWAVATATMSALNALTEDCHYAWTEAFSTAEHHAEEACWETLELRNELPPGLLHDALYDGNLDDCLTVEWADLTQPPTAGVAGPDAAARLEIALGLAPGALRW